MPLTIDTLTMAETLRRPELMREFHAQLTSEYSTENLDFYRATKRFQERANDPSVSEATLRTEAAGLYQMYVPPGSPQQINLPSGTVNSVRGSMGQLAGMTKAQMATMFDTAQTDIATLMERDSFARFKNQKGAQMVEQSNHIEELQARVTQLQTNPTTKDKAQAVFTRGGMNKLIENAQRTVEEAQDALPQVTLPTGVVPPLAPAQIAPQVPLPPPPVMQAAAVVAPPTPQQAGPAGVAVAEEEVQEQEVAMENEVEVDAALTAEQVQEVEQQEKIEQAEEIGQEVHNDMQIEEVDEIDIGEGRQRGQKVEEIGPTRQRGQNVDLGSTRGRSVRDALGGGPPKQGQKGPGVHGHGV